MPYNTTEHLQAHFAIVYTPTRGRRKRFPKNCVTVYPSELETLQAKDPDNHLHPAKVNGPFISSEGAQLYFLIQWLD